MDLKDIKILPQSVINFLEREVSSYNKGLGFVDPNWLHNLPEWSKATNYEKLDYADYMYPEGTKIKNIYVEREFITTLNKCVYLHDVVDSGLGVVLYDKDKNKWAKIIEHRNDIDYVHSGNTSPEMKPYEIDFNPKSGNWVSKPIFKAGDEVTLDGSDANTIFKIIHIGDEIAWIKNESMMFGRLVMLNRLRKPDPDKVYREIAKEIMCVYAVKADKVKSNIIYLDTDVESMLIEMGKRISNNKIK